MNSVLLKGRIVRPAVLSYTKNGKPKALFTLACDRDFVNQNGEGKKQTSFVSCIAWEGLAELVATAAQGELVNISGYIKTDSYEKDGVKKYATQVIAEILMLNGVQDKPSNFDNLGEEPAF